MGECADVDSHSVSSQRERFDERGPSTDMWVQTKVAWLGERLDGGPDECWAKTRGILVVAVGEASHRLDITRASDQRRLSCTGQVEVILTARFIHDNHI